MCISGTWYTTAAAWAAFVAAQTVAATAKDAPAESAGERSEETLRRLKAGGLI